MKKALFKSVNLIGDALYVSPALNVWHRQNPGYEIFLLTQKNHVAPLYSRMGVPLKLVFDEDCTFDCNAGWDFAHKFDVNDAFALCDRKKIHVAEAYAELLGVPLEHRPDHSHVGPIIIPTPEEIPAELQGLLLVSMFSASCTSREGKPPNKMLPWETWRVILRYLRTLELPMKFLGGPDDRTAALDISEDEYMLCVPLNRLALIMKSARLLVTLDNGMSHLAASQKTPTFLFYPQCLGLHYILPKGNPYLAYLHMNPIQMKPEDVVTVMKNIVPMLLEKEKK